MSDRGSSAASVSKGGSVTGGWVTEGAPVSLSSNPWKLVRQVVELSVSVCLCMYVCVG